MEVSVIPVSPTIPPARPALSLANPVFVPAPAPRVYTKTLPIYLNCVRCRVAKIFLNQRIHPVRVSVCLSLSIYLVCPPVSFLHALNSKPNVLESIRNGGRPSEGRPPPSTVQPELIRKKTQQHTHTVC